MRHHSNNKIKIFIMKVTQRTFSTLKPMYLILMLVSVTKVLKILNFKINLCYKEIEIGCEESELILCSSIM